MTLPWRIREVIYAYCNRIGCSSEVSQPSHGRIEEVISQISCVYTGPTNSSTCYHFQLPSDTQISRNLPLLVERSAYTQPALLLHILCCKAGMFRVISQNNGSSDRKCRQKPSCFHMSNAVHVLQSNGGDDGEGFILRMLLTSPGQLRGSRSRSLDLRLEARMQPELVGSFVCCDRGTNHSVFNATVAINSFKPFTTAVG